MLFMVPKIALEGFLETMQLFIEQHREEAKRKRAPRGPHLTGGAVGLLRRSVNDSPVPSRKFFSAAGGRIRSRSSDKASVAVGTVAKGFGGATAARAAASADS